MEILYASCKNSERKAAKACRAVTGCKFKLICGMMINPDYFRTCLVLFTEVIYFASVLSSNYSKYWNSDWQGRVEGSGPLTLERPSRENNKLRWLLAVEMERANE